MNPIGSKHAAVVDRINNLLKMHSSDQVIVRVQGFLSGILHNNIKKEYCTLSL